MKALLEAGVHFGHPTHRWNPRMKRYIFTERNGIHVIDLQQTVPLLQQAMDFARSVAARGDMVLFVGTKKQAQESIETEAARCGMPYVTTRWLGGTLTNFQTIESRIDYLVRLEDRYQRGELSLMIKKEAGALFIVDTPMERIPVTEGTRMGIPLIAMCDTNSNPDEVDYPIPANDDAIRAVKLIAGKIADAIIEGQNTRTYVSSTDETESVDVAALAASGRFTAAPDDVAPAEAAQAAEPAPPTQTEPGA
jgi:small subunit ribosomal protein S2